MLDLMQPKDYEKWARFYFERFGFKCIPMTGKNNIALTNNVKFENGVLDVDLDSNFISDNVLNEEDWLDITIDTANRYSKALTGIACMTSKSNIIVVDFDDIEFFNHWQNVFKVKCPLVKTLRGFHAYFKSQKIPENTVLTHYYDILSLGTVMLPPSFYYTYTDENAGRLRKQWRKLENKTYNYSWHKMIDAPEVNLCEIGLIPSWLLTDKNDKNINLRERDLKLL